MRRGASSTLEEIRRIDVNREHRRRVAEEARRSRQEEAALLGAQCGGAVPDIDFHRMIRDFRQQCPAARPAEPVDPGGAGGIVVCVRKRPIQQHEMAQRELDCVTACNPFAIVHERKFRVDGITKCLESHQFEFDRVFDEDASTDNVYGAVAEPLVPWAIQGGGRVTVFAYGQTGSGKTHTMTGLQRLLARQIFDHRRRGGEPLEVSLSFFEIYGGRPYDLLNGRQRLDTLEDARNEVQIAGLTERAVGSPDEMLQCIELGNSLRTTHATAINRDSSRSHAVCAVFLRAAGAGGGSAGVHAKITLVDLAGSERAADSKSTIRQRRVEGAQINKSLLALKECIRAMGDPREAHVPFRASKLTLVLRDAFVSRCPSRTVMIACISPGMTSADHSVNTLRYSDRLKDHPRAPRPAGEGRLLAEDAMGGDGAEPPHRQQQPQQQQQQQQAQHPLPPRPGSPGLFAMEDGEEEEDLRERLIAQVKARQKASKGVNKRWREFCQKEGGGIFDPNRHDAGFLEDFIERESRTVRLQGQSGRSRSRGRGASASGTRGGRWREDSGSLSSPRRPQRARRRSPKTGKRRGHRHGGRRREKHRPRDEEAAGRGRARDRKRRRRQRKTGKAPKEKASASPSGSSDSGESSAPSSELVAAKGAVPQERPELVTARSAAEAARAARISAEAALDEAKEATAAEVETRVRVEEERQQAEVARFVQEVEREARWEEEERVQEAVRQAREAREAKVEASRHRAEEDAREAVLAMRSRAREDVALRLETAEARVKDASAEESRTATALEVLLAESARLRQAGAVPEDGAVAAGGCRTRRKAKLTAPRAAKRRKERANENSGSGSSSSSDSSSEGGPSGGSSIDSGTQKHP